jgi:fido (protein-threonine AMPylation protein)
MSGPLDAAMDATPLTAEEREGLIPSHVTLRGELNELEQQNILEADAWASSRRRDPVSEPFGRGLHRRMFRDVWRWAGTYRTSDKSLGVQWQIDSAKPIRGVGADALLDRQQDISAG